ncbi:MAG: hypothetical protein C4536_01325 [Actinobacteria bacterium]|jgi:hypothetical protein|nr:MAG: hypothetical protein C4536_01325 [Actinomycetota bacterium]
MDAHDFVTFSARRKLAPLTAGSPRDLLLSFLTDYVKALGTSGCSIIGHIKGIVEDGESPPLFFSATSLSGEPQLKGGPLGQGSDLALTITVIVSGVDTEQLSRLLDDCLAGYFLCTLHGG